MFSGASALAFSPHRVQVIPSYHNDVSPPLREMPAWDITNHRQEQEAPENPKIPNSHVDSPDPVVDNGSVLRFLAPSIPAPILNFDGIPFPGVGCNCAPPDTNGEVGATQYVQMVNEGYQVFDKATGNSILGPNSISSLWSGFGGVCETGGSGDPVVLYDQLADRWVISQFATATGGIPITDECVAVSTTSDATGSYNRYGFHLGSNFFDYPHLSVWPDAYYMSMNVFNCRRHGISRPAAFRLQSHRHARWCDPPTFISPVGPLGGFGRAFPAGRSRWLDLAARGRTEHLRQVSETPGIHRSITSMWTLPRRLTLPLRLFATPAAAGFTALCPTTRSCVPESGVSSANKLDGIGDRLMFRLAYRNFGDHESLVGNFTVSSGGVAGIRWFELRDVTAGPVTVFQESTYQPDTTWRWMGSAAMDFRATSRSVSAPPVPRSTRRSVTRAGS